MARADAHRNRERLIAAAHAAMTTTSPATTPMSTPSSMLPRCGG